MADTHFHIARDLVRDAQALLSSSILYRRLQQFGMSIEHLVKLNVGCSVDGSTLFYYQNIEGSFVNARSVFYDVTLQPKGISSPSFLFSQKSGFGICFYNEISLSQREQNYPAILVENELTAVIGSFLRPQYVWLSTGSVRNFEAFDFSLLRGRYVVLLLDREQSGKAAVELSSKLARQHIKYSVIDRKRKSCGVIGFGNTLIEELLNLTDSEMSTFEERAGIMEYDCRMTRIEAEKRALDMILDNRSNNHLER